MIIEKSLKIKFIQKCKCGAVTISNPISKNTWILDVHGIGGNC